MHVTWDPNKAEINFKKHGIHFSDADVVLYDPFDDFGRARRCK